MSGFLKFQVEQINRRDLCLKYIAEKKRDRGALLLHLTPANRLHAAHSFPPRRAHSRRRPSPIRFFSGKYRHKSLYTHFPRICSKTPHTDPRHYRIGAAEQTASAVVCRIAPHCHFVDLYVRSYTGYFRECKRQGFASGIYVCKKYSAVSPDDDCERNAEKADEDAELFSRT